MIKTNQLSEQLGGITCRIFFILQLHFKVIPFKTPRFIEGSWQRITELFAKPFSAICYRFCGL